MKIKRIIAVAGALTALTITGVGYTAHADPLSPLVPNPRSGAQATDQACRPAGMAATERAKPSPTARD